MTIQELVTILQTHEKEAKVFLSGIGLGIQGKQDTIPYLEYINFEDKEE